MEVAKKRGASGFLKRWRPSKGAGAGFAPAAELGKSSARHFAPFGSRREERRLKSGVAKKKPRQLETL